MGKTILYAKNAAELIKILNNNPGTKIVGGCTRIETLPEKFISTRGIKIFLIYHAMNDILM